MGQSTEGRGALSSVIAICKEFLSRYPKHFGLLFLLLLAEGIVVGLSVMAVVPMMDFLLDPSLSKVGRVTSVVLQVLDRVDLMPSFVVFGGLFFISVLFRGLFSVMIRYAILRIKYAVVRGLFGDALKTFFKARWGFFSGSEQGRLLNTLNKELNTIGDTLGALATFLANIIQLAVYLAVPIWLNASMTLTALGLAVLFGLPFLLLHKVTYRLGRRNTETANVAMGVLSEMLGAARLILGFGRQQHAQDSYLKAFDQHIRVTLRSQVLSTAVPQFFQPMAVLAVLIALGFSIGRQAPVSELAAVMWSLLAAIPILASLLQGNVTISNFLPSYEQLVDLRRKAADFVEIQGDRIFSRLDHAIELRHLGFTYPGRSHTLVDVNMSFRKGEMVALVGESGAGKSTITDLVLGLQVPDEGEVLIDGVSLGAWNQNSFRERVGYVPQDPQLFHMSIRQNLLWSDDNASEAAMWDALRAANADQFVRDLPEGIDTIVGDRGVRLSGGQRQRIALARAVLRMPELLILDEATSALDSESERLIQQSIDQLAHKTTILVIAHRLSTVAKADMVYVMKLGQVVEQGSFVELSARLGGMLRGMIEMQQSNGKETFA